MIGKLTGLVAVVLFCFAPPQADAGCFGGVCGVRADVVVGQSVVSSAVVQNVVTPVVSQRVRTGLFGRTIIGRPRVKNVVTQQVIAPAVKTVVAAPVVSAVSTVAPVRAFIPSAAVVDYSGYSAAYSGYSSVAAPAVEDDLAARMDALSAKLQAIRGAQNRLDAQLAQ